MLEGYKFLGKGAFTCVWGSGREVVLLTRDEIKVAIAESYWEDTNMPSMGKVGHLEGDYYVLKGKQYSKLVAPKKQLKSEDYEFYQFLIKSRYCINYGDLVDVVENYKECDLKSSYLSLLTCLSDYTTDLGSDFTRRNFLTDSEGNLIFSDCFYTYLELRPKRPKSYGLREVKRLLSEVDFK